MKKFFFTLLLMGGAFHSYAQEEMKPETTPSNPIPEAEAYSGSHKFSLGVTAGYNASTVLHDDAYKIGSGFNAGFIGLLPFAETKYGYLFFEPSVLYSRECYDASKASYWSNYDSYDPSWACVLIQESDIPKEYFNHLKVPVQVGYEFKIGSVVTLGPKVGFEYECLFLKNEKDFNYLNVLAGLNLSYKRKFRVWLGWQSNLRTLDKDDNRTSDYVNINANLAYLFF